MNKGTSQKSRINVALSENYISIDERSMLDMVKYTLDFAQIVNFYNLQNKVIDNWKSFLLNDSAFIIAMIATTDITKFKLSIDEIDFHSTNSKELELVAQTTWKLLDLIANWSELLVKTKYKGFLLKEILMLKSYADDLKSSLQSKNSYGESIKETYENIYGNIVFIRESAFKKFEEEISTDSNHLPHIGLLLAFFELFKNVQHDINSFTKKHLDFYFQTLLQQKQKSLKPGTAIIGIQLQQGTEDLMIDEGDKFDITFGEKQQLTFNATSNTKINRAEIAEIRTLYKSDSYPFSINSEDDDFSINNIYEADILNDVNFLKNPDVIEYEYFPATLGEELEHNTDSESKIIHSEIGLIVSSPALILEKGRQEINLTFKIAPASYIQAETMFECLTNKEIEHGILISPDRAKIKKRNISKFFSNAFNIFITDQNGWKKIEYFKIKIIEGETALTFNIPLNEQDDRLIAYDPLIHAGGFESQWPCIKLLLNSETQYHPYKFLRDFIIENISIEAEVSDVTNLTLSNSVGNLDHSIPFSPFGATPVTGSFLRIQNPLILQANLTSLNLKISWNGLPQSRNGFADYYRAYPYSIDNKSFKAIITQKRNGNQSSGKQYYQPIDLFNTDGDFLSNEIKVPVNLQFLNFTNQAAASANNDENASPLFIVLTNPEIAFGHQMFTNLYAEAALKSSKYKRNPIELPNQPYTPVIEHLTVDYTNAAKEIMLRKQDIKGSDIQLIHINPFGHVQVFPGPVKSQCFLLPQIEHKGNLHIGLKYVNPGEIISIGFELIPAIYIHTVIDVPKIKWEYLMNNEWEPLADQLLEDSTMGLLKSGIVKIEIPKTVQFDNTRLPQGKFWIRAVYDGKESLNSRIRKVFTQAVSIMSAYSTTDPITELIVGNKVQKINFEGKIGIDKISGPFAFEFSHSVENDESFYCRVSEQMRHKNRCVSNWDVERIILNRFKNIEQVRVYGKNSHPKELVKGSNMQIVLIPKHNLNDGSGKRSNMVDFCALLEVKEYISQFVSPFVKVEVSNPVYEQLKVRCSVKFRDFQKRGYYKNVLNNELINYLSPDIENTYIEKGFDESISKTEILNFIESRPYIAFVSQLSVLQIVKVGKQYKIIDTAKIERIEDLRTISAYAILTSAPEHQIEIITDENTLESNISGIGDFYIESDFVISDEKGKYN
jgi:hypothetical protein